MQKFGLILLIFLLTFTVSAQINTETISKKDAKKIKKFTKKREKLKNQSFSFICKWRSHEQGRFKIDLEQELDYRSLTVDRDNINCNFVYGGSLTSTFQGKTRSDYDDIMINLNSKITNYEYTYNEPEMIATVNFKTTTSSGEIFIIKITLDFNEYYTFIDIYSNKKSTIRYEGVLR